MTSSSPSARLRPFRPQPFGRYTLLSHLATGGMGEIYLARLEGAQGFEKLCVIKKILPQLAADKEFVDRFVGEARTLVKLSHGSIAQVLDMGLHEGDAYMALEHVDGKDLRKVAGRVRDRQMPLPLTFILYVMGRVLDALAYAHRKRDDDEKEINLVHRDISPQNILISYEGEVKVIDFGLAKSRLSAAKTNPSIILGKFLYMSPEQARHQPVDRRSDLYAVGLCLYELISGKNPFDSVPPGELMPMVANPRIAPLNEVEPLTPPMVAQLVMKALAVEPAQRFQTAEDFRGKLQSCLHEIDANAGPESVSRFMRDLFSAEFQSERKLLAQLKDVARVSEQVARPSVTTDPMARVPNPLLPPKTIKLDGPVEPLSFQPTPRSRDGRPVDEGDTRPGVPMEESTRPGASVTAPEPVSRSRMRPALPTPATTDTASIEVRPEAFDRLGPPVSAPASVRTETLTVEVPIPLVPAAAIPPGFQAPAPSGSAPAPRYPEPSRPAAPPQPPAMETVRVNAPALPPVAPESPAAPGPAPSSAPLPAFSALMPPSAPMQETTDPHGVPPAPPQYSSPPVAPAPGSPARESVRTSGIRSAINERALAPPARSAESTLPPVEQKAEPSAAEASRRGMDDTHPSYKMKANSPRIHDTQPGVVLEGAPLDESEEAGQVIVGGILEEEESAPAPARPKPARRTRNSSAGMPQLRTSSGRSGVVRALDAESPEEPQSGESAVPAEDGDPDLAARDPRDDTRRTPIPTRPGEPRGRIHREGAQQEQAPAPAQKKRSWVVPLVAVVLLGLVGGAIALTYPALKPMLDKEFGSDEPVKPPPAVPLTPPRPAEPEDSAAMAPPAEVAPSAPAPTGEAPPAPAPATPAVAEQAAAADTAPAEEPDMLVPLTPSAQPTAKKPPARPTKKPGRKENELQKEWSQTSRAFIKLTEVQSCESPKVGILCKRYETLQNDVETASDANAKEVQGRVKKLRVDIQKAMNSQ